MPAVHIQICVCVCMCMYPKCVCKVCMGVHVGVSSKGNTIYMKLYKNGCWNNKMHQKNKTKLKHLIFKFWKKLILKKRRRRKEKMIISWIESNTFKIMHTFYKT